MNTDLHFSSATGVWETPQTFFDALNTEFHFTTDVCALPENAKCAHYYTPEMDGLKQTWQGVCWCNPPYGRGEIDRWCKKAAQSQAEGATVVMLLPSRTDTVWFNRYVFPNAEIRLVVGRLKFGEAASGAPFPSLVAVFNRFSVGSGFMRRIDKCGRFLDTFNAVEGQG